MWFDVPEGQFRLSDIVPLAYEICDIVVALAVRGSTEQGSPIQCRKGCSACCSYLVELTVPEAFALVEDLGRLSPAELQRVQVALVEAEKMAIQAGVLDMFKDLKADATPAERYETYLKWWRNADAKCICPMLVDDACGIHPFRLTACRQLNSISPPEDCAKRDFKALVMPLNVGLALGRLAAELEGTGYQLLLMPMLIRWVSGNFERAKRTWPSVPMVRKFLDILVTCANSNDD